MKTLTKHHGRRVDIHFEPSPDNPQLLRVKRRSDISDNMSFMDLPITEDQLRQWLGDDDHPGVLIQKVMPHLDNAQREFLISGCTPGEWADMIRDQQ